MSSVTIAEVPVLRLMATSTLVAGVEDLASKCPSNRYSPACSRKPRLRATSVVDAVL